MNKTINVVFMKRKSIVILVALGFTLFFGTLGPQMCPSDLLGLEFMLDGKCPVASHTIGFAGTGVLILFFLPLFGLLQPTNFTLFPEGFGLPLFRPPRFKA
jgi:hypothetical protein